MPDVTIGSPASGATVEQTFQASGTYTQPGGFALVTITATMTKGGTSIPGAVIVLNGNWTADFNGVPVGGGWTLEVTYSCNGVNDSASSTNITVTP